MALLTLGFNILCSYDGEDAADLGKELAVFLHESLFNGEDVLDVKFTGYKMED